MASISCLTPSESVIWSRLNAVSGTPACISARLGLGLPVAGMVGAALSMSSATWGSASGITWYGPMVSTVLPGWTTGASVLLGAALRMLLMPPSPRPATCSPPSSGTDSWNSIGSAASTSDSCSACSSLIPACACDRSSRRVSRGLMAIIQLPLRGPGPSLLLWFCFFWRFH